MTDHTERANEINIPGYIWPVSREFAQEIIEAALAAYAKEESVAGAKLRMVIRRRIMIQGFRPGKSDKAKAYQMRKPLSEQWTIFPDLADAVIDAWKEENADFMPECNYQFDQFSTEISPGDGSGEIDEEEILREHLDEAVRDILDQDPDLGSVDKVRLAIWLALKDFAKSGEEISTSDESIHENRSLSTMEVFSGQDNQKWEALLSQIRNIPAEDDCWLSTDSFLSAVKEIASAKEEGRNQKETINALKLVLEEQRGLLQKGAEYFQIQGLDLWDTGSVAADEIPDTLTGLKGLVQLLEHFEQLERLRPATLAERRKWEKELHTLEEQIVTCFQDLQERFTTNKQPGPDRVTHPGGESDDTGPEPPDDEDSPGIEPDQGDIDRVDEPSVESPELPESGEDLNDEGDEQTLATEPEEGPSYSELLPEEPEAGESDETVVITLGDELTQNEHEQDSDGFKVQELLFRRLGQGQLVTAYWMSWGLEQLSQPVFIPSWLIAAVQGVLWHQAQWPALPQAFAEIINEQVRPEEQDLADLSDSLSWMSLAAGIYMNLTDASGRWESWLDVHDQDVPTHTAEFISIVREYSRIAVSLDPALLQALTDAEALDREIVELSNLAKEWLQQAPTRGTRTLRAAQVWQSMVRSPKGELYRLVQVVASDHRSQSQEVFNGVERWRDRSWLDKLIQKIDLEINGKKSRPIVGSARDQLISWVLDIIDILGQYCHLVNQSANARSEDDWTRNKVLELCKTSHHVIGDVIQEMQELSDTTSDRFEKVGSHLAKQIFEGLAPIVALDQEALRTKSSHTVYLENVQEIYTHPTLVDYLAYSLVRFPELDLLNDGKPDPDHLDRFVEVLGNAPETSLEEVVGYWIRAHDYRFIPMLLVGLDNRDLWEVRIGEAERKDIQDLETQDIEKTVISVEQALLEGIIAEGEHTTFRSRIESIINQLRKAERDSLPGLSIRSLSQKLEEIREQLDLKREERLKTQTVHWVDLKKDLQKAAGDNLDLAEKIESVVEQGLKEQDLRATGEYLAHLSDVINGVKALAPGLFEARPAADNNIALEFQNAVPNLVKVLDEARSHLSLDRIGEMLLNEKPIQNFPMPRLPKPRLEDAARGLESWRKLKKGGLNRGEANPGQVETLMSFLGFNLSGNRPVSVKTLPGGLPNFKHWHVAASAGDFSPVAQFGSLRDNHYDVIGVWERPGFEIISSQVTMLMKQTGNKPTILLYFGRLLPTQREELLSITHKNSLPMLVVDETLLLFLTRQYDTRIKPMFNCTLPYAALNPFFPAAAGQVPPEVFKGRSDLVRKLIEPLGPAIVYGGRQLGKSALLRQVQREFHHPENKQYVIYEDIKMIGDPASGKNYQADFRDRLVIALSNHKLVEKQRVALDLDRLLNQVQQKLNDEKIRLLLLLDEADHFLDADAEKNFFLIQKLKNLMGQTENRFKVVLAGLHNVQRFQRIPNQPLAHLATGSIEIGPLDPEPARDLLVEPLHALGYHFGEDLQREDTSLVLHILSYTNYHPGLIQLFGSSLVEHLQNKYQHPCRLPLAISRSDVEAVYRKKEVRDAISERFNWTLALDPRYEAITLALILEQWDDLNGFDRLYTPKQLRDVAVEWWPEAFGDEITDDQFKGFLDEMRGLGVLSTNPDGNYRLRSPNLVSLMGTHDQIWERLGSLVKSTPPGERALENYHPLLEGEGYSPLSFAQERALNNPRSGVALIFGSHAVGRRSLDLALLRLVPGGTGAWFEVRIAARSANAVQQQLSRFVQENPKASFLVAYRELDGAAEELYEQVSAAVRYCQQIRNRTLRVCFTFDAQTAWQWFQLPKEVRESIEERVAVIVPLKRWDKVSIKQRLEMEPWAGEEVIASDRLVNKMMDVTGGWPFLLDDFFQRKDGPDPLTALGEFRQMLLDPEIALARNFIKSLGVYEALPRKIIKALLQEDISKMIQEGQPYVDVLSLILEDLSVEEIENTVEYLNRMAITTSDLHPAVEHVLAQLWYES